MYRDYKSKVHSTDLLILAAYVEKDIEKAMASAGYFTLGG